MAGGAGSADEPMQQRGRCRRRENCNGDRPRAILPRQLTYSPGTRAADEGPDGAGWSNGPRGRIRSTLDDLVSDMERDACRMKA